MRHLFERLSVASPEKTALMSFTEEGEPEITTYGDLLRITINLASGLRAQGFGASDRAAIFAVPSSEWIMAALGIVAAGGTVVPMDVELDSRSLEGIEERVSCKFVFSSQRSLAKARSIFKDAKIFLLDDSNSAGESWKRLLSDSSEDIKKYFSDPAVLFFTSGTTGRPKGVPLSQGNLDFQIKRVLELGLIRKSDRLFLPLPFHHVYPLVIGVLCPLALGISIVLPAARGGPEIVRALTEGGATIIVGVPRFYEALIAGVKRQASTKGFFSEKSFAAMLKISGLIKHILKINIGSVLLSQVRKQFAPQIRLAASGGAQLSEKLGMELKGIGWDVAIGYGLTETSPLLTVNLGGNRKLGSVGKPLEDVEIKLGERNDRSGAEEGGEILARGPGVFSGYIDTEDNANAFTDDGYFRTGDLGSFDKAGWLFLKGRASTMIVTSSGKNIKPEPLEDHYSAYENIEEIGILDQDGELMALVHPERRAAQELEHNQIRSLIKRALEDRGRQLAPYKRVRDFKISARPLPRTRLGKIRRKELARMFENDRGQEEREEQPVSSDEMSAHDRELLENPRAAAVWQILIEQHPNERIEPDSDLHLELGIDSLGWIEVSLELRQRLGIEIEEATLAGVSTVRDLMNAAVIAKQSEKEESSEKSLEMAINQPESALNHQQKAWLRPLGPFSFVLQRILYTINSWFVSLYFRPGVKNIERLPADGPAILVPNHISYLDPFVIAAVLPFEMMRNVRWAALASAVMRTPINRLIARLAGAIPVAPSGGAAASIAAGVAAIDDKKLLVWFPEGRRSSTGTLQKFKPGIGLLVKNFDIPIVPVHIKGTEKAMPVGAILPRPRRISLEFHDPVETNMIRELADSSSPAGYADALYKIFSDAINP